MPSNVKGENNSTSSFTVMLPKKLEFNSQWAVALTDLIYPFSFPNLGTNEEQYIDINWKDGSEVRLYFPKMTYKSFTELANSLESVLKEGAKKLCNIQAVEQDVNIRDKRSLKDSDVEIEGEGQANLMSEHFARAQRAAQRSWESAKKLSELIPKNSTRLNNLLSNILTGNFSQDDHLDVEKLKSDITDLINKNLENQKSVLRIQQAKNEVNRHSVNNNLIEAKKSADVSKNSEKTLRDSLDSLKNEIEAIENRYNNIINKNKNVNFETTGQQNEKSLDIENAKKKEQTDVKNIPENIQNEESVKKMDEKNLPDMPVPEALTSSNEKNKSEYLPVDVVNQAYKNLFRRLEDSKKSKIKKEEERLMANANIEAEKERLRKESNQIQIKCNIATGANFENLHEYVRFVFDEKQERFNLFLNKNFIENLSMSSQLKYLLGLEGDKFSLALNQARYLPDLRAGISTIYIYAKDLIIPTIIGDTTAPILRIVTIKGNPGDLVEEHFLNPQYFKLTEKTITQINIDLRTSSGKLVPFNYGDCILCLHFKKLV